VDIVGSRVGAAVFSSTIAEGKDIGMSDDGTFVWRSLSSFMVMVGAMVDRVVVLPEYDCEDMIPPKSFSSLPTILDLSEVSSSSASFGFLSLKASLLGMAWASHLTCHLERG
jgi:hypothetical protein